MRRSSRDRVLIAAAGALLLVSVLGHVYYILGGEETFWIVVTVAMAAFCFVSSTHLMGMRDAVTFLVIGVTLGLFFETLSVHTGFPFGPYYYTDVFGPGLFGVPYVIPLAWYVIVYLSFVIANLMIEHEPIADGSVGKSVWLSIIGAAVVTAYDLALDPFMVTSIRAWVMENPGSYFGEQYRGFAGWMLTSFLISITFRLVRRGRQADNRDIPAVAVIYPVAAYGLWCVFFAGAGQPPATRAVAVFAMGIPTLTAISGFLKWRYRAT